MILGKLPKITKNCINFKTVMTINKIKQIFQKIIIKYYKVIDCK